MGTNGTNGTSAVAEPTLAAMEPVHEEEMPGTQTNGYRQVPARYPRANGPAGPVESADDFALAPLVDKIAYGIASGLVVAIKDLENHIAAETRKVGDTVERRLDMVQHSLQELSRFVAEQRSANAAVENQLQQLAAADAGLRETDERQAAELDAVRAGARELSVSVTQRIDASAASLRESDALQSSELEALRTETRAFSTSVSERIEVTLAALRESGARQAAELAALQAETKAYSRSLLERIDGLCRDLGVQQEDTSAAKSTLSSLCARVDAVVDRLDRQADAVRLMHTAYSQRETELEQLVDGLARLRAFPTPLPATGL